MHSLILLIVVAVVMVVAWRYHRQWQRETADRARAFRQSARLQERSCGEMRRAA